MNIYILKMLYERYIKKKKIIIIMIKNHVLYHAKKGNFNVSH